MQSIPPLPDPKARAMDARNGNVLCDDLILESDARLNDEAAISAATLETHDRIALRRFP
jgi:hypothetical protein